MVEKLTCGYKNQSVNELYPNLIMAISIPLFVVLLLAVLVTFLLLRKGKVEEEPKVGDNL